MVVEFKKCAPKRTSELIPKDSITEELFLVAGSSTDYITKSGKIYKDYGNNKFYHKKQNTARKELNNIDGDIDITVCGHSTGGNQAQYVTIVYEKKYWK